MTSTQGMDGPAATIGASQLLELREMTERLLDMAERLYDRVRDFKVAEGGPVNGGNRSYAAPPPWIGAGGVPYSTAPTTGAPTLREAIDMALWIEREQAAARARQVNYGLNSDLRRPRPCTGDDLMGEHRPLKRPNTTATAPETGFRPCVICGQGHSVRCCPWRTGHCFHCGKLGHIQSTCPQKGRTPLAAPLPMGTGANGVPRPDPSTVRAKATSDKGIPPAKCSFQPLKRATAPAAPRRREMIAELALKRAPVEEDDPEEEDPEEDDPEEEDPEEDDPEEEDPEEDDPEEDDPDEEDPEEEDPEEEDPREEDMEGEDPTEEDPDEEDSSESRATKADRRKPGSGASCYARPEHTGHSQGPHGYWAEDAQSRTG